MSFILWLDYPRQFKIYCLIPIGAKFPLGIRECYKYGSQDNIFVSRETQMGTGE